MQFAQLVRSEIVKGRYRLLHPKAHAEFFVADLSKMGRQVSDRSKAFVEPLSDREACLASSSRPISPCSAVVTTQDRQIWTRVREFRASDATLELAFAPSCLRKPVLHSAVSLLAKGKDGAR